MVERTLGWLLSYKRLALRYDRTVLTISALAQLAVTLIRARRLLTNWCNVILGTDWGKLPSVPIGHAAEESGAGWPVRGGAEP